MGERSALAISVFLRFIVNTIAVDRNLDTFFTCFIHREAVVSMFLVEYEYVVFVLVLYVFFI